LGEADLMYHGASHNCKIVHCKWCNIWCTAKHPY